MPGTQEDLTFATTQRGMSDEEFLQLWHEAVVANDEQRIARFESAATRRWGLAPPLRRSISGRDALSASSKVVNLVRCRSPQGALL